MAEALIHALGFTSRRSSSARSRSATRGLEATMRSRRAAVQMPAAMGSPAKWTKTSKRAEALISSSDSTTRTASGNAAHTAWRVSTVTSCAVSATTSRRPMKPVPPVTSQRLPAGTSSGSGGLTLRDRRFRPPAPRHRPAAAPAPLANPS